jgi:hypothetical protein
MVDWGCSVAAWSRMAVEMGWEGSGVVLGGGRDCGEERRVETGGILGVDEVGLLAYECLCRAVHGHRCGRDCRHLMPASYGLTFSRWSRPASVYAAWCLWECEEVR